MNQQFITAVTSGGINIRCFHKCSELLKQVTKAKKHSSHQWLERQINDPYVEKARMENYRCRSAFKLLEIHENNKILVPGQVVLDCGAAPGSWTQVAVKLTNANGKVIDKPKGRVLSIDRLPFHKIEGAEILSNIDFTLPEAQNKLREMLKDDKVDVLLSDMAPNATGVREMDHENIINLAYSAFKFSLPLMQTGGTFLIKVWDGARSKQLENDLLKFYNKVQVARPQATRSESSEIFLLAKNFKGIKVKSKENCN